MLTKTAMKRKENGFNYSGLKEFSMTYMTSKTNLTSDHKYTMMGITP